MLERILCWIGWHDWGYRTPDGHVLSGGDRYTARIIRHKYAFDYRCLRCGVKP